MTQSFTLHPIAPVAVDTPGYCIFVRDLMLVCTIGVHKHERRAPQRVRVNIELLAERVGPAGQDSISDVVCYEDLVNGVRALAGREHLNLVETLAERIAALCLADARIARARVRVEKLDVFADVSSVGVEIERLRARR